MNRVIVKLCGGWSPNWVPTLIVVIFLLVNSEEEMVQKGKRDLELSSDRNKFPMVEQDVLGKTSSSGRCVRKRIPAEILAHPQIGQFNV